MAYHSICAYFADISPSIHLTHAHLVPNISPPAPSNMHGLPAFSSNAWYAWTLRPWCTWHLATSPDTPAHLYSPPSFSPWSSTQPHRCQRCSVLNAHDPSHPPALSPHHLIQHAHRQPRPALVLPTVPLHHHMNVHAPSHPRAHRAAKVWFRTQGSNLNLWTEPPSLVQFRFRFKAFDIFKNWFELVWTCLNLILGLSL